jgi:hypothetical protein
MKEYIYSAVKNAANREAMVFNNHLLSQRRDLKQHFKFQRVEERHRLSNT